MAKTIQLLRGVEANRSTVTPALGEPLYTTDERKLYIGDGSTAGGQALAIPYDLSAEVFGALGTTVPPRLFHMIAVRPFRILASGHQGYVVTGPAGSNALVNMRVQDNIIGSVTFTTAGGNNQVQPFSVTQTDVSAGQRVRIELATADSADVMADVMITLLADLL